MTIDSTIPNFPNITATFLGSDNVEVTVLGVSHMFDTDHAGDARTKALTFLWDVAQGADLNRPVRVNTRTADSGDSGVLIVTPEGRYYDETNPNTSSAIAPTVTQEPAPAPGAGSQPGAPIAPDLTGQKPAAEPQTAQTATPSMVAGPGEPRHHERRSFIDVSTTVEPARQGWRGTLNRLGARIGPGPAEQDWREDASDAEQHWPGPRTIAITNPKGGSAKTSSTVLLSALLARYGGAGVLAWDNNETRGTLAWRTEQGAHNATVLDLLPQVDRLLSTAAQSAELSYFAHHQRKDKYDVLQSDQSVEGNHEVSAADVEAIHRVASRYYRMVVMDSGNSERAANWRAMIDRSNALVVPCTNRADTAENGALMLEALRGRDEHSRKLAENAVVIVSNATGKKANDRIKSIADGFRPLVREVVTIPYDPALVEGIILFDALRPDTQRAWLRAAAAVARGL